MDVKTRFHEYDTFKFSVVIILILILSLLWSVRSSSAPQAAESEAEPTPAEVQPEVSLPEFPEAGFAWQVDEERGLLLDPQGRAVYRLNADAGRWEPVVPEALASKLPAGHKVVWADGEWQVVGPDGAVLYRWDPKALAWAEVQPEVSAEPEPTPSPTPSGDCAARPARLKVGDTAKVLTNLNLRRTPGIGDNWIMTMPAGTVVEVIGGPVCLPHGDGAYRWWQVRLPDGTTGWAAEAPIHGTNYFLEPVR
ncbi:MAG: SH3 domain-containing protein [Chloroflexi bacterium]|nr:SH3 domain-containing protein [Chloroflexota bacterium]